jgi:hypothetical protein
MVSGLWKSHSMFGSLLICINLFLCNNPIFYYLFSIYLMKYTQTTLDKLEAIPEQAGYVLRYERGTFQSGYCILEAKKVVVLNKFLQTEGRINTLIDLIPQLDINIELLTPESAKIHADIISKVELNEK